MRRKALIVREESCRGEEPPPALTPTLASQPCAHLVPFHLKAKHFEGCTDAPRGRGTKKLHPTTLFPFTNGALQTPVQPRQAILRR